MMYCREKATEWGVQSCLMRINEILDVVMSVVTDDITIEYMNGRQIHEK